jgi:RNA polymerase-binding transcription factor DksA
LALRAGRLDEIERLRAQIYQDSEQAEDDSDSLHHVLDLDHELTAALINHEQGVLDAADRALARIEAGTYGVCTVTGRPIPLERLEAVPYTEHSFEAEARAEVEALGPWAA